MKTNRAKDSENKIIITIKKKSKNIPGYLPFQNFQNNINLTLFVIYKSTIIQR